MWLFVVDLKSENLFKNCFHIDTDATQQNELIVVYFASEQYKCPVKYMDLYTKGQYSHIS